VTLIEGKVEIIRQAQPAQKISRETSLQKAVTLSPGERVTVRVDTGLALDHPKVEALTAWQRGEVMFDNASLLDATAEINRYGNQQVILAEPGLAELRVSGVFETRDPEEFAHAMAQLHHLNVRREGREILLER
jgi:transmembrane sensor